MKAGLLLIVSLLLAASADAQTWTCTGASPATWACTMISAQQPVAQTLQPVPLAPPVDVQKAILDAVTQLLATQQSLLTVSRDTNAQVAAINNTWTSTLADVGIFVGKYIAPAVLSWLAAKKLL